MFFTASVLCAMFEVIQTQIDGQTLQVENLTGKFKTEIKILTNPRLAKMTLNKLTQYTNY